MPPSLSQWRKQVWWLRSKEGGGPQVTLGWTTGTRPASWARSLDTNPPCLSPDKRGPQGQSAEQRVWCLLDLKPSSLEVYMSRAPKQLWEKQNQRMPPMEYPRWSNPTHSPRARLSWRVTSQLKDNFNTVYAFPHGMVFLLTVLHLT